MKIKLECVDMLLFKKNYVFILVLGRMSLSNSDEAPLGNEVLLKKKRSRVAHDRPFKSIREGYYKFLN